MRLINNTFSLNAVLKGVTTISKVTLTNSIQFFQFLDKSTGELSPNWGNSPFGPKFFAEVHDSAGHALTAESVQLHYNGTVVNFNSTTGISENTSALLNGKIKRTVESGVTYFQFIGNIFSLTNNEDNDSFYMTGNVTLQGGNAQPFQTPVQDVTVLMSAQGGGAYHLIAEGTNVTDDAPGKVVAKLFSRESPSTPISLPQGASYTFYNITGDTETECTAADGYTINGNTLTIPADNVSGVDAFKVVTTINGVAYSAVAIIVDETDPYLLQVVETGNAKKAWIDEGETVTFTAQVVDKEGTVVQNSGISPSWTVKKGDGTNWAAKSGSSASISFTYSEITTTGLGKITGYLTGIPTIANS